MSRSFLDAVPHGSDSSAGEGGGQSPLHVLSESRRRDGRRTGSATEFRCGQVGASQLRAVGRGSIRDRKWRIDESGHGPAAQPRAELPCLREARSHYQVLQDTMHQRLPSRVRRQRWLCLLQEQGNAMVFSCIDARCVSPNGDAAETISSSRPPSARNTCKRARRTTSSPPCPCTVAST